jgi:RNA polymerase sigma-70 factor (ECF subfamily)
MRRWRAARGAVASSLVAAFYGEPNGLRHASPWRDPGRRFHACWPYQPYRRRGPVTIIRRWPRPQTQVRSPPSLRLLPTRPDSDADGADDVALVQGLIAKEDWAVRSFWRRYAQLVYGIVDRALGSPSESEDLTQEVFFGLFRGMKSLRDPGALRSFVVASTVLRLRRHLRWKRVRRFLTLSETGTVPERPTTGADGHARDLLRRLYGMLDTLSHEDRTAFMLRNVEGFSVLEIAKGTQASPATVKRRIRRAALRVEAFARSDPDLAHYLRQRPDAGRGT